MRRNSNCSRDTGHVGSRMRIFTFDEGFVWVDGVQELGFHVFKYMVLNMCRSRGNRLKERVR